MFFELIKNSSIFCFSIVLLVAWIYFLIDFLGEYGVLLFLSILHTIIFAAFPLYLFEYFLTGSSFKASVSGLIFLISSCSYILIIISAFFLGRYLMKSNSFCDKLLEKIYKKQP